ncbi:very-long-chain aldehyde decarbonylase CER1-like isoform X2 [Nicotiana tabacum]|uniref:Very-long-chain aldehyde decarbonylase CER1-like isoform X2 n=1 Tax=Nicotiana tabacum TaxID=4097 RepID=A0AC58SPG9_TOBAC
MASKPGILTEWPWTWLGNFKYVVLAPYVTHSLNSFFMSEDESKRDMTYLIIFPFLFFRMLHNQIWISVSRYRTAKGDNRIVDKSIEFDQVDRERNWDDQIILNGLLFYYGYTKLEQSHHMPIWRTDGIIMTALLQTGPVEFLYYWLHRALHHHFLYSRYHSHHHSSIVTEPITSVIHPFAEHIAYFLLFAIPLLTTVLTGTASIVSFGGYITYIDFMNNMGHCNFEIIPKWMFSSFPPLKYLMYTPSLGFASFASEPYTSKWYFWLMWPVTLWSMMITWIYGHTFTVERNVFKSLNLQTWAIPKYRIQYFMQWQRETINNFIEEAIMEADRKGIKVLSLGLLNQEEQLNNNGELYIRRHPQLKVKVVDGSSLAVAVVLNSIPKGTTQVVLGGHLSKVANAIALALCQGGVKVVTLREEEYKKLKSSLTPEVAINLVPSKTYASKIWLVGDGLSEDEQLKAPKGTLFIPFSQFPPRKARKDCLYFHTPAMITPKHFENVDSCENWLPRRVMSAWRVAGILHALKGWNEHECGNMIFDIEKVWKASLDHGFSPLTMASASESKA